MAHKKHNQTVAAGEWWDHLRPPGKRQFWKKQRRAFKAEIRERATPARPGPRPVV